jgi:hypothetical protein
MATSIKVSVILLSLALLVSGCASGWRRPAGTETIQLRWSDSVQIKVGYAWLEQQGEEIVLRGHVGRQYEGSDTTRSYLRIAEIGTNGEVLHVEQVSFDPRLLTRRIKPPHPAGYFRYVLQSPGPFVEALTIEAVDSE